MANNDPPDKPARLAKEQIVEIDLVSRITQPFTQEQINELQRRLAEQHNSKTRLFSLPAEVRNRVFELCVEDEIERQLQAIPRRCTRAESSPAGTEYKSLEDIRTLVVGPAFFNTCRKMRFEGRSVLYLESVSVVNTDDEGDTFAVSLDELSKQFKNTMPGFFFINFDKTFESGLDWMRFCNNSYGGYGGMITVDKRLGLKPMIYVSTRLGCSAWEVPRTFTEE